MGIRENEVHLPSGLIANVREMTGEEEDMFLDRKKLTDGRAVNHMIHNCTLTTQPLVEGTRMEPTKPDYNAISISMLSCDRIALMAEIRKLTYGNKIKGTKKCDNPECREVIHLDLSMEAVDLYPTTIEDVPDGKYDLTLEDGTVCHMKLMDGQGEQNVAKAAKEDILTMAIMVCIDSVDLPENGGQLQPNDKRRWLKKMSARVRQEIRGGIESHHIGPDTRWEVECPECGMDNVGTLEQLPNFFFPSTLSEKMA